MKMTILEPGPLTGNVLSGLEWHEVAISARPTLEEIHLHIDEYFSDTCWERVNVLYQGVSADMFVDERGHAKKLPRNDAATLIYWTNQHVQLLQDKPSLLGSTLDELCRLAVTEAAKVLEKLRDETAPVIRGRAVFFHGRIWS